MNIVHPALTVVRSDSALANKLKSRSVSNIVTTVVFYPRRKTPKEVIYDLIFCSVLGLREKSTSQSVW